MSLNGEIIYTKCGVPQGAKLSPTLFTIYIDDLIRKLNDHKHEALAFADDIVVYIEGKDALEKVIRIVNDWSSEFEIEVNCNKSAILQLRADKRTRAPKENSLFGYPVLQSYKYLGIMIDDCLQL